MSVLGYKKSQNLLIFMVPRNGNMAEHLNSSISIKYRVIQVQGSPDLLSIVITRLARLGPIPRPCKSGKLV